MRGLLGHFSGIFWRLARSYIFVTVVAALTIESALAVSWMLQHDVQPVSSPAQILEKANMSHIAPYLAQPTPDTEALQYWFAIPLFDTLANSGTPISMVAILDQTGHLLASAACTSEQIATVLPSQCAALATQRAQAFFSQPQTQATIMNHLANTYPAVTTTAATAIGQPFLLMPIAGTGKHVVGGIVALFAGSIAAQVSRGTDLGFALAIFWSQWQPDVLLYVTIACVLGTLVGLVFARTMTRRLERIIQAAEAWSRGEFTVIVQDRSHDELGRLAQHLNGMAAQLHALVETRHRMAILEERQRLQRELHDAVKQQLFAVMMQIAAARACFATEVQVSYGHIVEAEHLAGQAQRELTTLIHALRPGDLDGKSLADAVEDLCRHWSRQADIPVEMHIDQRRALSAEGNVALYRVVQEALANVMRHSGATQAMLLFRWEGNVGVLTVVDNGHGFDTAVNTTGLGLRSMRERIAAIGGTLRIESSAKGTQIQARVPIPQGADDNG